MKKKNMFQMSWLYLAIGVLFFLFSNGNWTVPIAAWIAPVFFLRFLRLQKGLPGLSILFGVILVSARFMLWGIVPPFLGLMTYGLILIWGVMWYFPFLVHRVLANRLPGFAATLVFPVAGVVFEYAYNLILGSWMSIAYTQYGNLSLMQLASVTGIWGITFLVLWFGSIIEWMWNRNFEWLKIKRAVILYSLVVGIVLGYGGLRLNVFCQYAETVPITSFTPMEELEEYGEELELQGFASSLEVAMADRDWLRDILSGIHDAIFESHEALLCTNPFIIAWPEGAIKVLEEDEQVFLNRGEAVAKSGNIYLLMAYFVIPKENPSMLGKNKCVLINPEGQIEWHYLKAHPVPGSTDEPGDGIIPVSETPFSRIGTAICYDMDFTGLIHQAGRKEIDIMLVPGWDWKEITPLHTQMAVFRAIENGFSMVRQSGEGLSMAVDYAGRTLSVMDHFNAEEYVMMSQVPKKGIRTICSYTGDLFAWLCCAGFAILLVVSFLKWRIMK